MSVDSKLVSIDTKTSELPIFGVVSETDYPMALIDGGTTICVGKTKMRCERGECCTGYYLNWTSYKLFEHIKHYRCMKCGHHLQYRSTYYRTISDTRYNKSKRVYRRK